MKDQRAEITTIFLPLTTEHRTKAGQVFREMRKRDPRTVENEKVFLALAFGSMIEALHTQLFPKLIHEPGLASGIPSADEFQRRLKGQGHEIPPVPIRLA